jgi:putative ABC transport system permease protein
MAIPIAYNLRNLVVRKTTTIMTALGIALTVATLLAILALVNGLRVTLTASGDPLRIIVLRQGADSELVSNFVRSQFQDLKFKQGIAIGAGGQPLASLEMVTIANLGAVEDSEINVNVRALLEVGRELRPNVHISSGRWYRAGQREVVVGKMLAEQHPSAHIGNKIRLGRGDWVCVGVMDGGGGATDSEVWGDLNQISSDLQRIEILSSATVKATDAVTAKALINDINNDQRLNMTAVSEKEYYDRQTASATPIRDVGIFVAIIMAVGSSFAAMNTMYAAVPLAGDRYPARAGILARQHHVELLSGIGDAVVARGLRWVSARPAAEWLHHAGGRQFRHHGVRVSCDALHHGRGPGFRRDSGSRGWAAARADGRAKGNPHRPAGSLTSLWTRN